ncbi:DNA-directed RNA polymerase [Novosphingobium meiothermophilum]|uniref:DNA-directed RNA polymerase n=1 Tax=Novosphingobium meiothermophilum TaxID=2202251 RepID=UPI001374EF78|nr:DNA-directed RNA polymerase [Novosphingobium meiothermophilum]
MVETRDLIRRQLDLEAEAHSLGATRYRQNRPLPWRTGEDLNGPDEEANLPPGQALLKQTVKPTADLLREKLEAANSGAAGRRHSAIKWLEVASPEEVAYLAGRVALNASVSRSTFQTTSRQLGEAIIDHVEMVVFSKENKPGYRGLVKAQQAKGRVSAKRQRAIRELLEKEGAREKISTKEKIHLGSFALDCLIEATGFFAVDLTAVNARDKVYMIRPTEAVEHWLEQQHARCELLDPMLMPMVVRPRRWRTPFTGGYLGKVTGKRLVKAPGKDYQDRLRDTDLSLVYEAVNHIQETPWQINRDILRTIREVWDSGGSIAGLPARDDTPLPPRIEGMETDTEALRTWKREAAQIHEANANLRARRLGLQQRLWLAERFVDEEAFWFPHNMDFRGRIYPIPATGLHPQSDDIGKALLRFAEGKPLGESGAYWLAVHIANLFGVDKVSFAERHQWTWDHVADIVDSALFPLDGRRFWATADSPWMALAACIEFAGFLNEGPGFVSHLPIPLDGSNSGLQHFSALLRDPVGGAAVNLVPAEVPQDVYRTVSARAQEVVDGEPTITIKRRTKDGEEYEETITNPWLGGKVTRKIAKRPTMTFVYSATRFGMQDMILQTLREIDAENAARGEPPHLGGADNYQAALYLSHVLFRAVSEIVSAASDAMDWLRKVAKVASDANVALEWTTPDGLLVRQAYRVTYGERVKVHWQGRPIKVTLAVESSALDGRGQANGIAPNYVHSMDAAHLRAVGRGAKAAGIGSLAVIHDSFGTHAADTDRLVTILRETFVQQYEKDHLAELYAEVCRQLPPEWAAEVPLPPEKGTLDLTQVKSSRYLFA